MLAWIIGIVVVLLILVAITPTILSTRWGNDRILRYFSRKIPGKVFAKSLDLSWFGAQKVEELNLTDPSGLQVLHIEELSSTASLWSLLFGSRDYGKVEVHRLLLTLDVNRRGITNLDRAIGEHYIPAYAAVYAGVGATAKIGPLAPGCPTGSMHIFDGEVRIEGKVPPAMITDLEMEVAHPKQGGEFHLTATGKTIQDRRRGSLHAKVEIEPGKEAKIDIEGDQLPVILIDQLCTLRQKRWRGLLTEIVGDSADIRFEIRGAHALLWLDASRMSADFEGIIKEGALTLKEPGHAKAHILPQAGDRLLDLIPHEKEISLLKPVDATLVIDKLNMDLFPPSHVELDGKLTLTALNLSHPELGSLTATDTVITAKTQPGVYTLNTNASPAKLAATLNCQEKTMGVIASDLPVGWVEQIAGLDEQLIPLLGKSLSLNLQGYDNEWTIRAKSDQLDIPQASFMVTDKIILSEPTHLVYTLTPELWAQKARTPIRLEKPSPLAVELQSLQLPLQLSRWREGSANLTLTGEDIAIDGIPRQGKGIIERLTVGLAAPKLAKGDFQVHSMTAFPDKHGTLACLLRGNAPLSLDGQYEILQDGTLKFDRFEFRLEGRNVELRFIASYTAGGPFEFLSPPEIHYIVTPDLVDELLPTRKGLLKEPFSFRPTVNPGVVDISKLSLETLKLSGRATFSTIDLENAEISNLKSKFSIDVPAGKASMTFSGKSRVGSEKGKVRGNLSASHFMHQGELDLIDADLTLDLNLSPIPSSALMIAFGHPAWADHIEALFGQSLNLNLTADLQEMEGPFALNLSSKQTTLTLKGLISNESLRLTEPLDLSAKVTPEIGKTILKTLNPLFVTALRSDQPIHIHIDDKGFSFPLFPYNPAELQVGHASIDLGKIWVQNRGPVNSLLKLFKREQLTENKELAVWSTPAHLSIHNGIVNHQRMDTRIGTTLQVALWGTANVPTHTVNMTLGIPGQSLRKILGISDIPDDYYLLIPVRGTPLNPTVDWATGATRASSLLARKAGKTGKTIGAVLEAATGQLKGQKDVPPPTTKPFSWEK